MRNPQKPKTRIALAFPMGLPFVERLQQGIVEYAQRHGRWSFTRVPEMLSPSIGWLRDWPGDGAFVLLTTEADAQTARALPIPVVNLAGHLGRPGVPTVMVDHKATGRLAAEHLLARRFSRFGFYGTRAKWYSEQRRLGFLETVNRGGGECAVLEVPDLTCARSKWADQQEELERWLERLTPPAAIMASTDLRAGMVLDACQRLRLRVPQDVAVIGVDNDPVACEFCHPPLSSVSRSDREVGYEAALLLHRLLRGLAPPAAPILVPPDRVVLRRSTAALAIEDVEVAAAVAFVQAHLHEAFGVERLREATRLSRRRLEHRFRQSLGRTPGEFINRQRVALAQQLLEQPDRRNLTDIAAACGFTELRRFRLVFRRVTGMTPMEYRRRLLPDSASGGTRPADGALPRPQSRNDL